MYLLVLAVCLIFESGTEFAHPNFGVYTFPKLYAQATRLTSWNWCNL